ncbi:ankyrin repeat-containing protein DDB_G0279043-like isoform X2 [Periplaneta americana]|uniref:ankyrin repeat-containing protein DDB_G0279043-like isoform X2 n=1 Tax=Periplaneta americana TaxID=6978 RepID=UPI0037E8BBF2
MEFTEGVGVTIQQVSTTEIRPSKRFFAHSACCKRVFKGIMTLMVIVIVVNVIVVIVFLGLKRDEEPMKRQAPPTKKKVNCSPSVVQDLARVGCYDKLKRELARGVPINKGNRNGSTFLHKAAHGNQVKIAKLLLDRGADIEAARNNGETPLHTAALWGSLDMARFLIQRGANLNPRIIPEDLTPLQLAAKRNYLDIVKQLVLCGADYSLADKDGMTAQRLAEKEGKRDVAEWLGSYSARPHPEVNDTVCRSGNATTIVN